MLIGILSDSHARVEITRRAVAALLERGADTLIHLGDLGSEAVLEELAGHDARVVWGNCDWPTDALARCAQRLDIAVDHPAGRLEVDGRRIAYTHGHLSAEMDRAMGEGVDYLLHGHSHIPRDERLGRTRVINPGALFRAARYTAAVLDPARDAVTFIEVARDG